MSHTEPINVLLRIFCTGCGVWRGVLQYNRGVNLGDRRQENGQLPYGLPALWSRLI